MLVMYRCWTCFWLCCWVRSVLRAWERTTVITMTRVAGSMRRPISWWRQSTASNAGRRSFALAAALCRRLAELSSTAANHRYSTTRIVSPTSVSHTDAISDSLQMYVYFAYLLSNWSQFITANNKTFRVSLGWTACLTTASHWSLTDCVTDSISNITLHVIDQC